MKIIETIKEFNSFLEQSKDYDWLIVPTYCNGSRPVYTDSISIIYVYVLNLDKEVLVVFNHTEGLSLPIELLEQFPKDKNLFIYNKKRFKKFLNTDNLIDMSMVSIFTTTNQLKTTLKLQHTNSLLEISETSII
jgi:hypothetical protein